MTLRLRNVQLDVPADHYAAAVTFWADALGGDARQAEGPYVHLDGIRAPVGVHVQCLESGEARYHLDLEADDPAAEAERLVALGAQAVGDGAGGPVLRDPSGLLFCVCAPGQEGDLAATAGDDVRLHFVVLDFPQALHERALGFWSAAFGMDPAPVGPRFPAFTFLGAVATTAAEVGILVQDVGDDDARIHLDLHVPAPTDRDRELARLEAAGATRVGAHGHWVVMAAPGGHLFCVVPDRKDDS